MRLRRIQAYCALFLILIASLILESCLRGDTTKNPNGGSGTSTVCGLSAKTGLDGAVAAAASGGAVAAGLNHTVALKGDGTVWAWGSNLSGQLGNGTTVNCPTPVSVIGLTGVVGIAGGYNHTLAVKNEGTVWSWGENLSGQLGIAAADGNPHSTPVQVVDTASTGFLTGINAVAAGESHSLALRLSDGTVWSWGNNSSGQLGIGSPTAYYTIPIQVKDPLGPGGFLSGVTAIAAGGRHSIAIKNDGTVWTWGQNSGGQLGDGTQTDRYYPVLVFGLSGMTAIKAGDIHTVALKSDGTVWTWGSNNKGQLGDGTILNRTTPLQVLTGISGIASGYTHTLVVKTDGTVWAFGDNFFGQLGLGAADPNPHSVPVQVSGLAGAIAVAAGGSHSLAIKSDGTVWAWGENQSGQLGDGTVVVSHPTPVQVSGLSL